MVHRVRLLNHLSRNPLCSETKLVADIVRNPAPLGANLLTKLLLDQYPTVISQNLYSPNDHRAEENKHTRREGFHQLLGTGDIEDTDKIRK